jgi:hypothetical protein
MRGKANGINTPNSKTATRRWKEELFGGEPWFAMGNDPWDYLVMKRTN